ncbi:hypothetical protein BC828DRAFT_408652 [Blastocladiella britannica]|nr:hypothetical protein BC828DRAFT_408652 [Blastocladiella britannica]
MHVPLDVLLPDELLRVSKSLDISGILAFRAASRCMVNLTPSLLEHDANTHALIAIASSGTAESANAIICAQKSLEDSPSDSSSFASLRPRVARPRVVGGAAAQRARFGLGGAAS